MQILTKVPNSINQEFVHEQFHSSLYDIPTVVLDYVGQQLNSGTTLVLFSGGHRLHFDATYIEARMFSCANINWQKDTIFVDPSNTKLLNYIIEKKSPDNLLILNSVVFIKYRDWQDINNDINHYKKYCNKIIVSMPLTRFNFNRLKYSNEKIADIFNGTVIEDTVIVCR